MMAIAAPAHWPYLNHRTMESVMRQEAASKVAHAAKKRKRVYSDPDRDIEGRASGEA